MKVDILVIGGGAAGLAAALAAHDPRYTILVVEREPLLGGILNQCIHNGFGLHVFKEELTGPEYANRYLETFLTKGIDYLVDTTVIDIEKTDDGFIVTVSGLEAGLKTITSRTVILASGCYERTRGSITLAGDRPKGIMPAGSAQRYLNMDGYLVGERIFILGSGDIGLIMARRMVLEGAKVLGVAEIMPYSNGLTRNIVQCLHDYDIPLYLSHTVTHIEGRQRLEAVTIQAVDADLTPIPGTEQRFEVDTLLLSVGLIPDVTLFDSLTLTMSPVTRSAVVNQFLETSVEGLFVCGNALHVHDLVDYVSDESHKAGLNAKAYLERQDKVARAEHEIIVADHIRYVVPQMLDYNRFDAPVELMFRTTTKAEQAVFRLVQDDKVIKEKKARYVAPAEMEKMMLDPQDLIGTGPVTLYMEVVKP